MRAFIERYERLAQHWPWLAALLIGGTVTGLAWAIEAAADVRHSIPPLVLGFTAFAALGLHYSYHARLDGSRRRRSRP
jgi:hypothetical protein